MKSGRGSGRALTPRVRGFRRRDTMNRVLLTVCLGLAATSCWSAQEPKLKRTLEGHSGQVCSLAFSPDGKTLASGSADHSVKLWDVITGRSLGTLEGHNSEVASVVFSPDGKTIASAAGYHDKDKTIKLWDAAARKIAASLKGHTDAVASLAFSPDGKTLAFGKLGQDDYPLERRHWQVGRPPSGTGTRCRASVAFAPNGKTLASAAGLEDKRPDN